MKKKKSVGSRSGFALVVGLHSCWVTACLHSVVAGKESVVTIWRNFLQIAERRKDDLDKANAAHQLQQQQAWKRSLATAELMLCTRCPLCKTAFLFEDGCVALKCLADHTGICYFCCFCDLVGA